MTFGEPTFLWGLLLIPLIILGILWANRRRRSALARLGNPDLVARLTESVNLRGRRWQQILWVLAAGLALFALAHPQWGEEVQVVEQEGIQVMVALDVSESMLAEDLTPTRLDRAKLEISELMDKLNGDEIGLVLFSGAAFIQFPLTSDYDTARAFLQNARPGLISRPGTVIGQAIRTAMSGFDDNLSNQKVIVIMTDGEDHETDPIAAAQEAAEAGTLIYTIGFGSLEGEPIPQYDPAGNRAGFKQDANGNIVLSRLEEVELQRIAAAGGGRYYRSTADGSEIDAMAEQLDALQTAQLESRFETQKTERFQSFLLVALVALLVHELIPARKRERK